MENEYLAHHGVKGMKWGVRKAEKPSGSHKHMSKREAKAEERKQKIIARNKAYMKEPGVAKHIKFDNEGYNIVGISKTLQKALDAPLEDIDDEELIFVTAMELGGDSNLEHADQYLVHHGVKGMKWGVRKAASKNKAGVVSAIKARREDSKPTFEQRRETALTTHSAKKLAQNMDTLDDKELQQRYNRLNLEQNVRNLSRNQVSSGRKMVGDVGKEVAKEYAKKYAKKGAKYLIGAAAVAGASYAAPKVAGVGVKALTKLPGGW